MKYIIFLFLALSSNLYSQTVISEMTLEQYVPESPSIKTFEERLKAAQSIQGSLGRSFLPKVQLSYGHERYTTGPYYWVNQPYGGIEAKINVFNSGKDSLESTRRDSEAKVSEIDAKVARSQVLMELRKALAQYAYLYEVSSILKEAVENNEINIKSAQQRVNAGLSTKTDTLDFKQQKINLTQEQSTLEFEMGVIRRLVSALLGLESNTTLSIDFKNTHPEHEKSESKEFPITNSLLFQKANLLSDISTIESKQASRWWTPSVDIYGYALRFTQKEREYPTTGQRNDVALGFRIVLPIFDGGESIRQAQAKSALAKAQEASARAKQLEIERDTTNAKQELLLAHELIHNAEQNVEIMNEYRKGVLVEYTRGVKNSPDVLQASQRWIQSKSKFAEVKKNYQIAKAETAYFINLSE